MSSQNRNSQIEPKDFTEQLKAKNRRRRETLAQIQQATAVVAALTKQVNILMNEKDQKQLELASKERIAAADRAARIEQTTITARAMIQVAAFKGGQDAAATLLDQQLRTIENRQDTVENAAERELTLRLAQEQREHEQAMAAQQQQQAGALSAGSPPAGAAPPAAQ